MGEPRDESGDARTPLERYRRLERIAIAEFPRLTEHARIERDPGDTPRNLRLFLRDGSFLDIWLAEETYSYHWQGRDTVVRFDNAPHHDVKTNPHHRHIDGDIRSSPLDGNPDNDIRTVLETLDESWVA